MQILRAAASPVLQRTQDRDSGASVLTVEGLVFELETGQAHAPFVKTGARPARWLLEARELTREHFAQASKLHSCRNVSWCPPAHLARMFGWALPLHGRRLCSDDFG